MMFARVLWTETLKIRRTLAVWMVLIAPLTVVTLQFMVLWQRPGMAARSSEPWMGLARGIFGLWGALMLPLFLTLEAALLAGLEHGENNWKTLFALPAPRWHFYTAKLAVLGTMIWSAGAVVVLGIFASGLLLPVVQPKLAFPGPIPWTGILEKAAQISLLASCALALQHWISLRWRSFTVAVSAGIVGVVAGFILMNSEKWGQYWPWVMTLRAVGSKPCGPEYVAAVCGAGAALAVLGCVDFCRREVR